MKKRIWSLMILLVALCVCTSALAVDALNLWGVSVREDGTLGVVAATDHTNSGDMTFRANTENGELEVTSAVVLRNEGTSWFVILDYGRNVGNDYVTTTQKYVLEEMAGLVRDIDEGALVPAKLNPDIAMQKAGAFQQTLKAEPPETDTTQLDTTVRAVFSYINENRGSLMPNVAVVIITPASPRAGFTTIMMSNIEQTLIENNNITTHIVTTAPTRETGGKEWRELAEGLADKAYVTVGGTGYATKKLDGKDREQSQTAVTRINDAERQKIYLALDPHTVDNIGHELTVVQTIAGGKELVGTGTIPDDVYNYWEETLKGGTPDITGPENNQKGKTLAPSSIMNTTTEERNTDTSSGGGISTELIAGIIGGVVILALAAVLLIMKKKGSSAKKQSASVVYGAASSAPKATGVTITLLGADGKTLKGQMKNNRLTIGRDASRGAMIAVPGDGKLSGIHATFTRQGNTMTLTDNGSTNGTKVNGSKITGPVTIQQNDTIAMGSNTYTVSWR